MRLLGTRALWFSGGAIAIVAGTFAVAPQHGAWLAGAATITNPRPQATQITGTSSGTLLQVLNTSTGGGIIGQVGPSQIGSATQTGVYGVFNGTSGNPGNGVLGFAANGTGVVAETFGGAYSAIYAQNYSSAAEPAILGVSNGNSIVGTSADTNSIVGITNSPTSTTAAGILGEDLANDDEFNDGVLGTTTNGNYGVEGMSTDGAVGGVHGAATTGYAVRGDSTGAAPTIYGYNLATASPGGTGGNGDAGVEGQSSDGPGSYAYSSNWYGGLVENNSGVSTFEVVNDTGTGNPIILFNRSADTFPFYVSATGSVTSLGYIMSSGGGTLARTRNPSSDLVTYGAQQTESTVEDFGSGQLVNGAASVPLRPDFAQTADMSSSYMVFITPDGDTNGLFVASKSPAGFVVRESRGGRSTVAFDYRIVAHTYGQRTGRLPHYAAMVATDRRPDGTTGSATRLSRSAALSTKGNGRRSFATNHIPAGPPPSAVQMSRILRVR